MADLVKYQLYCLGMSAYPDIPYTLSTSTSWASLPGAIYLDTLIPSSSLLAGVSACVQAEEGWCGGARGGLSI